jgi:hypothetical protein
MAKQEKESEVELKLLGDQPCLEDEVELKLLGDQPWLEDKKDWLGYDGFIEKLAALIVRSAESAPLTIGIEGQWGTGKTTFMRRLRKELQSECATIWFEPWKYQERDEIWKGLITELFKGIDKSALQRIFSLKTAKEAGKGLIEDAFTWLKLEKATSAIKDRVSLTPTFLNIFESKFSEILEEIVEKEKKNKGKEGILVIFIDDLDRCLPEATITVLEAIKIYMAVPKCVLVLGYERNSVSKAISAVYRDIELDGGEYLNKIVQVPITIPRVGEGEKKKYIENCLKAMGNSKLLDKECQDILLKGTQGNPREIKSFLNGFVFLNQVREELDTKKLLFIMLLQRRWPSSYRTIESEPGLLVDLQELAKPKTKLEDKKKISERLPESLKGKSDMISFFEHAGADFKNEDQVRPYLEYTGIVAEPPTKPPSKEEVVKTLRTNVEAFNVLREQSDVIIDLEGADLRGTDLRRAYLSKAYLEGADLEGAYLSKAYLERADLEGADLRGADLGETDLGGADLGGADLAGADLGGADLEGANLGRVSLRGANLRRANLGGANLEHIEGWKEVHDFTDTDISAVRGLSKKQIDFAVLKGAKKTA